jgi:hypothetical protein
MEPSGRNRWQPLANDTNLKTPETGENRYVPLAYLPSPRIVGLTLSPGE